jgi:c(7)-type cytochrome triheme protein
MSASTARANDDFNKLSFQEGKYCGACHNGSGAFAVQDEANCNRCHGNDVNPSDTIILENTVKSTVFDHALHNKELGLACNECHMKLFDMKTGSTGEKGDFTMKAMYDGKYCGACHNGSLAFDLKANCTKCHVDTPEDKGSISGAGKKEGTE